MKLLCSVSCVVVIALAACGSKKDQSADKAVDKPVAGDMAAKPADQAAPAPAPAAAPAPAPADPAAAPPAAAATAPVKTTPAALFDEFTKPGADTMALIDKYAGGATFTGKIKSAAKEASGKPVLFMDVDGKRRIDLGMTDGAPFAKVKVGDTITVTCKIGGADGDLMQVTDCTKQ
jgi:hypothetical protein